MVQLLHFCGGGPWDGRICYTDCNAEYIYVAKYTADIHSDSEIEGAKESLKKYKYRINGNHAVFKGEET